MNTLQLVNALSKNPKTKRYFRGVFASDRLPKEQLKKPCIVIANTDPSDKGGMHWVSFYFPAQGKGHAEYLDSFGLSPYIPDFISFLERNCTRYIVCKQQIQGNFSTVCGHYSSVFLYFRCVGKTMKHFLSLFSRTNLDYNDDKIINLYQKYFKSPAKKKKKKRICNDGQGGGNRKLGCIQKCMPRLNIC